MMRHIDTHEAYKELVHAGAQAKLAESIIKLVDNSWKANMDNLATKQDLESQIGLLKQDLKTTTQSLESQMSFLKQGLETEIKTLESLFKAEISVVLAKMDANFRVVFVIGGIVSTILVVPILQSWLQPIISRLTHF